METANFCYRHDLGPIYGWFGRRGLAAIILPREGHEGRHIPVLHSSANDHRVWKLSAALDDYFAGVRQDFHEIPVDLSAGTSFQRRVWEGARRISWGEGVTYGELAKRIGRPGAARAVGQAISRNSIPIVVPCHRVLAWNGLGGFSAGLAWKRELLKVEGIQL